MTTTGPNLVTFGETMAMFYGERIGSFAHLGSAALGIGGAESNVAIAAARLGATVHWIGRVGDDSLGRRVLRELRGESLSVHATIDETASTGLMVKERPTSSGSRVRYYRSGSAGSRITAHDLPIGIIRGATVLHVTGITPSLSATAAHAIQAAVRMARESGTRVSFDVNHRSRLWSEDEATPVYRHLASQADIVFAGVDEARLLAGGTTPSELAHSIGELGPSTVVIKRAADGAFALIDDVEYDVPALPITLVDAVGAGDAFVGAYLAELLAGADPEARLRTASAAGAFACTVPGDWEGMPTRADLDSLVSRDDVDR